MRYEFRPVAACNMCGSINSDLLGLRLSSSQGLRPKRAVGIGLPVKRCSDCGLIYSDPLPIPNDISDHYGDPPEEYWSAGAFHWQWTPAYFSKEIETAKQLIDFKPGMEALDIGTGLGKAFKSLSVAGFDTWGCEPSRPFREKSIEIMGIDPDRIQLATVEGAEYEPGSFDFITFGAVLEHLYDPKAMIERAFGWLKPGGVVQIEVPNSNWLMAKLVNRYFRLRGTNYVTNISPMHPPYHLYEFTLDSFRNYDVAEHWFEAGYPVHVPKPMWLKHAFQRYMRRTDTGMQLTVFLRK